ncbi:unnamed protein product [Leptidea sinapis]|uniref:NTR domain-containing protein n=1 Tax=Leptidea sinapis TaxID=189913 RepID=A0A5E4QYF0_9NEOP|nr:unnamed protein product [Leptidea sinapis]
MASNIIWIFLVFIHYFSISLADSDESDCVITFSDVVEPCDGFDNQFLRCKGMTLEYLSNNGSAVRMSGTLEMLQSIDDDHSDLNEICSFVNIQFIRFGIKGGKRMEMRISKVSGTSCNDVMWVGASNVCGSIKDEKTPWYPVIENMKITECPIATVFIKKESDLVIELS